MLSQSYLITSVCFLQAFYPFLHEIPFILVSTVTGLPHQSSAVGNLHHPAYAPTILWDFPRPWSLPTRVFNFVAHVLMPVLWSCLLKSGMQREVRLFEWVWDLLMMTISKHHR